MSLTTVGARVGAAWEGLWFRAVPATSLGLMRLSLGLLLVIDHLWLWPQLHALFSAEGPVPPAAARVNTRPAPPAWR